MNLSNFTIKAAEVIQGAQQIAFNNQHSNIETEHLLKALLQQDDSPVDYLLKKNAVNVQQLEQKLDQQMAKLPQVKSGEPAQNVSRDVNNVVLRAGSLLKGFGDEFITPEHLMLSLLEGGDNTAKLLKQHGEVFTAKKLYDNQLPGWTNDYIQSKGYTITPRALTLLVDHIGNDLNRIANEFEKSFNEPG